VSDISVANVMAMHSAILERNAALRNVAPSLPERPRGSAASQAWGRSASRPRWIAPSKGQRHSRSGGRGDRSL
jgi:hypothetical protein